MHEGVTHAASAEQLMRSRYSSAAMKNAGYMRDTLWPREQKSLNFAELQTWLEETLWTGLEVLDASPCPPEATKATVEFKAKYLSSGKLGVHHELSLFRKKQARWFYVKPLPL
nr:YchJ family metal-binding protein [Pseudovibrio hongkongensis]